MPAPEFSIRVARADEFHALCQIDVEASSIFAPAGVHMDLPDDHAYFVAERARWLQSVAAGAALVAVGASGTAIGFAAGAALDGQAYLEQLSVHRSFMRRGIGTALLKAAESNATEAGFQALWLTTYNHLPWNRPFYEQAGFEVAPEAGCGPGVARELASQRRWLPFPEQRVAMKKQLILHAA